LPKAGQAGGNAAFHFLKLLPMALPIMLLPDFVGAGGYKQISGYTPTSAFAVCQQGLHQCRDARAGLGLGD
jgi:hypothetical protein